MKVPTSAAEAKTKAYEKIEKKIGMKVPTSAVEAKTKAYEKIEKIPIMKKLRMKVPTSGKEAKEKADKKKGLFKSDGKMMPKAAAVMGQLKGIMKRLVGGVTSLKLFVNETCTTDFLKLWDVLTKMEMFAKMVSFPKL